MATALQKNRKLVQVLNIRNSKGEFDDNGYYRREAKFARIGVMPYIVDGKISNQLVPEEELTPTLNYFSNAVLTLDHPEEFLDSFNTTYYQVGHTGSVVLENGWMKGMAIVTEENAITAVIQKGYHYFSNAYYADMEETSGVWKDVNGVMGEVNAEYPYDSIQRNLSPNHIAIVKFPRAGKDATFENSSTQTLIQNSSIIINKYSNVPHISKKLKEPSKKSSKTMPEIRIINNDQILTVDGDDGQAIANLIQELRTENKDQAVQLENSIAKVADLETQVTTIGAERDVLQNKVDEAPKQEPVLNGADFTQAVMNHVSVWSKVKTVMNENDLKLPTLELKRKYLNSVLPHCANKIANGSELYIEALWDAQEAITPNTVVNDVLNTNADTSGTVINNEADQVSKHAAAMRSYDEKRNAMYAG